MTNRSASASADFTDARPFEIFRAGTHAPMSGAAITFADTDLAAIASAYDPTLHQAPIVVGHPAIDAPAYGWISGLAVDGDRLVAMPEQVDPAFADLVREGKFKKVSASFYRPSHPANPAPSGFYLRHVGFLGAQPPAVKGLKPVEFGDDADCVTVEFGDWATASGIRTVARLFRGLREWIIGSAGQDAADRALPDWDLHALAELPGEIDPAPALPSPAYATSTEEDQTMSTADELEARDAALRQRQTDLEMREAAFAEADRNRRVEEDRTALDALAAEGRLPMAVRPVAEALFAEIRSLDGAVNFADGDVTVQLTPRAMLLRLLQTMPLPVVTGEIAFGEAGIDGQDPQAIAAAITASATKFGGDVVKGLAALRGTKK